MSSTRTVNPSVAHLSLHQGQQVANRPHVSHKRIERGRKHRRARVLGPDGVERRKDVICRAWRTGVVGAEGRAEGNAVGCFGTIAALAWAVAGGLRVAAIAEDDKV